MTTISSIRHIAFLGNYTPRKCGIATFTSDLRNAVADQYPQAGCPVTVVNDRAEGYAYPDEVRFEIAEQDLEAYRRAATYLNYHKPDVVCIQHEFGIYGGRAGSHLLALMRELTMPIVTTLHTVLKTPEPEQRMVMDELAALSSRLIVMTEHGRAFLREIYRVPDEKIEVIAHGIPDIPFVDSNCCKHQFGVAGRRVLLTFGLLSPNKGIENVIAALPEIVAQFPDVVYIVLGATHPNLVRDSGEAYRHSLEQRARDLGVEKNVLFYNQFVEIDELMDFITAADIYITPYLNPAQITSGTLAYAFGSGKPVVSTPYWHAEELLAEGRGILVPFGDSQAIIREVIGLLSDEERANAMRKQAYALGREMTWRRVAQQYMAVFEKAFREPASTPSRSFSLRQRSERAELPPLCLDHLRRMSDSTGILQHATFRFPNYAEGYCTDDNARALILTTRLEEGDMVAHRDISALSSAYAAFLNHAFAPETGRFRNFMSYDRKWLEEVGSDDSHGRALWALGTCVGRSRRADLKNWAMGLFHKALPEAEKVGSPRAWAFALLGISEYSHLLNGERFIHQVRGRLTERLLDLFARCEGDDWRWCEDGLTYDNAALPHALIRSGHDSGSLPTIEIGLRMLRWLAEVQTTETGHFRPIGSNGFYRRNAELARFDQQPLEAYSMITTCLSAYRLTEEEFWLDTARAAFDWFLGRNDLGLELYDRETGGCRDGLHSDRVNQNQGAESTLAFLLSYVELAAVEKTQSPRRRTAEIRSEALSETRSRIYRPNRIITVK